MSEARKLKDEAILRDAALLFGWIAGLLLIAGLCWFLTQPLRGRILLRAVNRVLADTGDSRRLMETSADAGRAAPGSWYRVSDGTNAAIFAFIADGSFFPCAAILAPDGKVEEFIPLTNHGKKMIKRVSPGILRIYSSRFSSGWNMPGRSGDGKI